MLPWKNKKSDQAYDEFAGLIETHLDGLYGVALRYTRQSAAAEDLVHDTVVRALRFRESFQTGSNFKAWIYTILTNTFIHKYRRQRREREILQGEKTEDVEGQLIAETNRLAATDPENSYLERMLSDDVLAALNDLPDEFRKVIVLCDIEGLSYKEIADALECPVGTVMSRLYRGRRVLENKLAQVAKERGILRQTPDVGLAIEENDADVVAMNSFKKRKEL